MKKAFLITIIVFIVLWYISGLPGIAFDSLTRIKFSSAIGILTAALYLCWVKFPTHYCLIISDE
ncbi:hypothetical protein [Minisyncoccus archaeiphilus]|uniref:hypothetical protein n=1 Tax=Minisyncoccus archaeiphilus TaxID=3238481 RepID=UPI00399C9772